ncbi:hypothetical protein EMIHUDRAFT_459110 [Emiliania huxleyi CCMP1516]|uniref:Glycosyl transferase family 1 domain-containing protein n=2 Tax=Emiliania huxleyi TaxID=2903 RepID=A0A0D3IZF8_EMIH1|nr:hypothetical protein EMIHUDRAFT_459110 [Emiliania huxleyi CCMP1516]EOD16643.1 hypothetical protein EMIHUDRAFT_459110 [Emiliania huxleyi CCMP1516]|eukprot:XP_005769072.1 hypothetical protein EMIHUDRAFT_459110 [Emiliania huxleyi CCMP1516]
MGRVLVLSSLRAATGNAITAARLAESIRAGGHECLCRDSNGFADAGELSAFVAADAVSLVVGIHAYRSGRLLVGSAVPYVLVLGGTDMNVMMADEHRRPVMLAAAGGAGAVVAFSRELLAPLTEALPAVAPRCTLVPQAIRACVPPRPPLARSDDSGAAASAAEGGGVGGAAEASLALEEAAVLARLDVRAGEQLLLLPAGLRPVKDVLYAAAAVAAWRLRGGAAVLRIVGHGAPSSARGVFFCAAVLRIVGPPLDSAYAATAEGMCNSILEAFAVGTPVLARRNAGNASLVTHGESGLLFTTPDAAVALAQSLLDDRILAGRLAHCARGVVARGHSEAAERAAYAEVLRRAELGGAPAGS